MQVSLNELVQLLADRVGQPFNVPLQEELKVILNYKRADWIQKVVDKHPEQRKYFFKYISDELVDVDEQECPLPTNGCTVKRTSKKIPRPIRTEFALFDYVGDPDRMDGYTYTSPEQLGPILKYGSKYTKDRPKYMYANEYVYVYNEDALEYITIGGVWANQRELNDFKCDNVPCYTDNDKFDIPEDLINVIIQDVLKNELKLLIAPEQGEVTVDDETKQ